MPYRIFDRGRNEWVKNTGNPYIFPFSFVPEGKQVDEIETALAMKCAGDGYGHIDTKDCRYEKEIMYATGISGADGSPLWQKDIVRVQDASYGIFRSVVDWNSELGCFAICVYQSNACRQLEMPAREWMAAHMPCATDGCMYAYWYTPLGRNKEAIVKEGNIFDNADLFETTWVNLL